VIDLHACRVALADALRTAELNVSDGGDLVPNGAAIGPFVCAYHRTIGSGNASVTVAGTEIRVVTDRASEADAYARLDAAMSFLPHVIEQAPGPWLNLVVQSARPDSPLQIGEASYASLALIVELHV
jgi:hypothetical protein